jgi:DNA invertase Pin-like site-specific DNA recombinase
LIKSVTPTLSQTGTPTNSHASRRKSRQIAPLWLNGLQGLRVETARPPRSACDGVLQSIVDLVDQGDEIVVTRLNPIGRSSAAVLGLLQTIKTRGIDLGLLDPGLNRPRLIDD